MKSGAKTHERDVYSEKQNEPVGYTHIEVRLVKMQNCSFECRTVPLQRPSWSL